MCRMLSTRKFKLIILIFEKFRGHHRVYFLIILQHQKCNLPQQKGCILSGLNGHFLVQFLHGSSRWGTTLARIACISTGISIIQKRLKFSSLQSCLLFPRCTKKQNSSCMKSVVSVSFRFLLPQNYEILPPQNLKIKFLEFEVYIFDLGYELLAFAVFA